MKKILITLALTAILSLPSFAEYSVKAGLNINPNKINAEIPVNLGAEVSKNIKGSIISVSADYFVNEKRNLPVFLNYKKNVNPTMVFGVGLGKFFDSSKSWAASAVLQTDIDKDWFAEIKAIKRLETYNRNNYLLFSVGYKF